MKDINRDERIHTNRIGYIAAGLLVLALIGFTIYFVMIPSPLPPQ